MLLEMSHILPPFFMVFFILGNLHSLSSWCFKSLVIQSQSSRVIISSHAFAFCIEKSQLKTVIGQGDEFSPFNSISILYLVITQLINSTNMIHYTHVYNYTVYTIHIIYLYDYNLHVYNSSRQNTSTFVKQTVYNTN